MMEIHIAEKSHYIEAYFKDQTSMKYLWKYKKFIQEDRFGNVVHFAFASMCSISLNIT